MAPTPTVIKGECEACDAKDVVIKLQAQGKMMMCEKCIALVAAVTPAVDAIIASSHVVDASIKLKTDIFTAKTVAVIELKGAIDADETIAADMKDFKMAEECSKHYLHLKEVIFAKRQELEELSNEMRVWQVNTQEFAGKLRTELKDKFKQFDINYAPPQEKIKKPKSSTPKVSAVEKLKQAREAASKYSGLDYKAVVMIMAQKNMSADDAAKHAATMFGLIS